jgi:DNA-binding transcriptional regulator YiaG
MTPQELVEIRKRLGYKSRSAFAEAVGVTRQTVDNWEKGTVPISKPVINLLRCWDTLRSRENMQGGA